MAAIKIQNKKNHIIVDFEKSHFEKFIIECKQNIEHRIKDRTLADIKDEMLVTMVLAGIGHAFLEHVEKSPDSKITITT